MRHILIVAASACSFNGPPPPSQQSPSAPPSVPCDFPVDSIRLFTGQSMARGHAYPFLPIEPVELANGGPIMIDLTQWYGVTIWASYTPDPDPTDVRTFDTTTRIVEHDTSTVIFEVFSRFATWWPQEVWTHSPAVYWISALVPADTGYAGPDACTTPIDLHFRFVLRENPNCVWERSFTNLQPVYLGDRECPIWKLPGQEPRDTATSIFDEPGHP